MKVDIKWFQSAQNALVESGIVKDGKYPKAYKGYISSLAASIVQSGLIPALSIYESDNSGKDLAAENNRALLINAIARVLIKQKKLDEKMQLLADYVASQGKDIVKWQYLINRALVALKLAARMFEPLEGEDNVRKEKVQAGESSVKLPIKRIRNTGNPFPLNASANAGWIFYRDLYRSFKQYRYQDADGNDITEEYQEQLFGWKLHNLFQMSFKDCLKENQNIVERLKKEPSVKPFVLTTIYPGLLTGIGLNHGVKNEGDIKAGFLFDYTTGMPYIPGSSVKGALRSVFPDPDVKLPEYNSQRIAYLKSLIEKIAPEVKLDDQKILGLGSQLFDEDGKNREVFMDALITGIPKDGCVLANDYITPHKDNPFTDPVPIQFMKILPEVSFAFLFKLGCTTSPLTENQRLELYHRILLDIGIGAKTNVGYGHFKHSEP